MFMSKVSPTIGTGVSSGRECHPSELLTSVAWSHPREAHGRWHLLCSYIRSKPTTVPPKSDIPGPMNGIPSILAPMPVAPKIIPAGETNRIVNIFYAMPDSVNTAIISCLTFVAKQMTWLWFIKTKHLQTNVGRLIEVIRQRGWAIPPHK